MNLTATPPTMRTRLLALPEARWATASVALFGAGLVAQLSGSPWWLYWPFYLACYAAGGWGPAVSGLKALRDKTLDVDLLMVAAAIGAASIGQIMDGGLLIIIFATSGALEAFATARTQDSVRGLLDLAPDTAARVGADEDEHRVPVSELAVGDVITVRPGERVGADGTVIDGASEVDQATITGEPLPRDKTAGDEVYAGTANGTGTLRVRIDKPASESVVARIAALVAEASETKARSQLFIEKVERWYSIGMVAATVLLFTVPLLWGQPVEATLLRAMTFMIVASPCAVVLATMPPLLAAIANAGRHGALIKSAVVLERLGTTGRVAFDKTGTLTRGTPRVRDVKPLPGSCHDDLELLRLAASAEHPSEHPLAAAIVRAAADHGITPAPVTHFTALPGRGISARHDGALIDIGTPEHILPMTDDMTALGTAGHPGSNPALPDAIPATLATADGGTARFVVEPIGGFAPDRTAQPIDPHDDDGGPRRAAWRIVETLRGGGDTVVVMSVDRRPVAVFGIGDEVRAEAAAAVANLTTLTGKPPIMLTGDNAVAASRLGARVGITDVRADLLPHDKVTAVRELRSAGDGITVVGDGINDAPALAAADTGIAMGGAGADLTLDTADAVIVRDDLTAVSTVIRLARRARRVVVANLVIAAVFITGLVAWDLFGELPLPLGVVGHEGSTVIVGLNGLRLLREAAWRKAGQDRP